MKTFTLLLDKHPSWPLAVVRQWAKGGIDSGPPAPPASGRFAGGPRSATTVRLKAG